MSSVTAPSTIAGNDLCQTSRNRRSPGDCALARRNGMIPAIIVEAAPRLLAKPTGLDVFHQQRTGPVFRIRKALVENLHDRKAGIESDEIGKLQGAHGVIGAEPHRSVDGFDV